MKKSFCIFFMLSAFIVSHAQVSGNVSDSNGQSLPGVNVTVSSSDVNTITDFDGNFTIQANIGDELSFSTIGYAPVKIIAKASMKITLREETNSLEEVVVVGYGTKRAGAITGSIVQIKAADIVRTPAQSAIQAIQGKAAGVNIVTNDQPGANPTIRIRGIGTLLSGRDPLYVVDGVESFGLNGLSPNEIATIDILKDASSLAIYGQKGANGVIIVTTKKGRSNDIRVSFDSYYGQKFVQKKVKMANSFRFAYYNNTAQGSSTYFNPNQPYETDWFDEITTTGEVMSNYISFSGASENATYYFGATNYKEKGILIGTEYERTNISSRNEFKALSGILKISPNINFVVANNTAKPNSAFTTAYKQSPIVPVRFPNGRWGVPLRNVDTGLIDINGTDRFNNVGNPVAQLFYTNERSKNINISGSIAAELQLLKSLKFTSNYGATYEINKSFNFNPGSDLYLATNPTLELEDYINSFGNNEVIYNTLTQSRLTNYTWNWDNYFTFDKLFDRHHVTATLGTSRTTKNNTDFLSGTRNNVPPQSNYWSLDLSSYNTATAPNAVVSNSRATPIVSIAYFARADYDYDGKYLITGVVRREGTSTFQTAQKWGVFPSVSAGWVISKENFMNNAGFDFLKIRGGYGEIGNANVQNSLNLVQFAGSNYVFGPDQSIFPGVFPPFAVDPNLSWETMRELDLGIDFKILRNRLSGTFDVYDRESSRLIVPLSLPDAISPDNVVVNAGKVTNKGVEGSLRWDGDINSNFRYWISANYSYNKNELESVSNNYFADYIGGGLGNGEFTKQVIVGAPLGTFYVFDVTGFNSDGAFTYSAERVAAGSYIPTSTYGLNFGVTYKNFDFSVDTYGVSGNKIYNGKKAQRFGGENVEYDYLDSFWTPSTPNATNPRPYNSVPIASTYFIEDGSYFRINNITVGYTLPKVLNRLDKLRVYATAVNPFMFTKYSGYSPEVSGNGDPLGGAGIELDAYPTNKTFLLGLTASF